MNKEKCQVRRLTETADYLSAKSNRKGTHTQSTLRWSVDTTVRRLSAGTSSSSFQVPQTLDSSQEGHVKERGRDPQGKAETNETRNSYSEGTDSNPPQKLNSRLQTAVGHLVSAIRPIAIKIQGSPRST